MAPSRLVMPHGKRPLSRPGFDPQAQPLVPAQSLGALLPQSLQLDFIRHAFAHPSPWQVEPLFVESFHPDIHLQPDVVQAAVFMALVQRPDGLHVIFTRRAANLNDHAGQISFPGGRIDATDASPVAAALRETHEEIGVGPEFVQLIGTHPSFLTSTRFTMTPVIGEFLPGFHITPNQAEVAEVFEVPLAVLMDPLLHRLHQAALPEGDSRLYFSISWRSYFIWGATAALIRNFYRFLMAAQQSQR